MPLNKDTKPNQTEFKLALLRLKIDPVSHPVHSILPLLI